MYMGGRTERGGEGAAAPRGLIYTSFPHFFLRAYVYIDVYVHIIYIYTCLHIHIHIYTYVYIIYTYLCIQR